MVLSYQTCSEHNYVLTFFLSSAPSVSVQITDGGAAPTAGEDYQLTCSVSGAESLNPTVTYQWTKNSDGQAQVGTSNTLSFTPLRLSDAASYVCTITISSNYLTGVIVRMDPHDVRIQSRSNKIYLEVLILIVTFVQSQLNPLSH